MFKSKRTWWIIISHAAALAHALYPNVVGDIPLQIVKIISGGN